MIADRALLHRQANLSQWGSVYQRWQPALGGDWYWFELLCKYTSASLFATHPPRLMAIEAIFSGNFFFFLIRNRWSGLCGLKLSQIEQIMWQTLRINVYQCQAIEMSLLLSLSLPCTYLCKYLSPSVDRYNFQRYQSNWKELSPTFKDKSGLLTNMGLLSSATTTKKHWPEGNLNPLFWGRAGRRAT